jgi:hypothetical protein
MFTIATFTYRYEVVNDIVYTATVERNQIYVFMNFWYSKTSCIFTCHDNVSVPFFDTA